METFTLGFRLGLGVPKPLHSKAPEVAYCDPLQGVGVEFRQITVFHSLTESLFRYCTMLSLKAIFLSQDLLGQHVMSS